jgi:hypothetical protein
VKQQILRSQASQLKDQARKILTQTDIEKIEPLLAKLNSSPHLKLK